MQDFKVLNFAYNNNIDVIIGTSSVVSHVGFFEYKIYNYS